MTARGQTENRRLLPRWRPWQMALLLKELAPTRPMRAPDRFAPALSASLAAWNRSPTPTRGAEVLAAALSHNDVDQEVVAQVAATIRDGYVTSPLRTLAGRVLTDQGPPNDSAEVDSPFSEYYDEDAAYRHISELRARTRRWPRNALTWMDLSRAYFAQGLDHQARRCIEVSLALDPNNRFLVRSASRYLVHEGDEDRARRVVENASGHGEDPWLMSVTVALAGSSRRQTLRHGQALVEGGSIAPWHVGELSAALATRESANGASRMAKRLMNRALIDPTENVLAHAEWAGHLIRDDVPRPQTLPLPPHEALARRHAKRLEWASAAHHAWQWHLDEPFSPLAAGTGSCYAIYAHNFEQALRMTTAGLKASPADALLLNNRAFASACLWRLDDAASDLNQIDFKNANPNDAACAVATAGFVAFRAGDPETGRRMYERAVRYFTSRREADLAAMATINLASEETRVRSEASAQTLARAAELVRQSQSPEVAEAWKRLEASRVLGAPPEAQETSSDFGWVLLQLPDITPPD